MDADSLIKLTKASLKEDVMTSMEIIVPPEVKHETIDAGKDGGHADAFIIEENVEQGRLHVQDPQPPDSTQRILQGLNIHGGEADVLRLHAAAGADLLASDDARFLRLVEEMGIPFATPAALAVSLVQMGTLNREEALDKLDELGPHISESEHVAAREALLEGTP